MKKTLTIVTMFFSVTILMSGFSSIANEQKDELCSDCVPVVKQEKQRALGRFLRKFRNRLDESNCVTCENNAESAQNVPAPVAPAPAVKPAPVAPAPAVKPAPVAPAPAVKPAPVAPAPAAKPAPVAPAPAVKPAPVAPAPAVKPAPVAPAPAVKPAPVAPAPAVKPAPVAPAPAVKPAPVAPAPAVKPAPVTPAPAVKPAPVTPVVSKDQEMTKKIIGIWTCQKEILDTTAYMESTYGADNSYSSFTVTNGMKVIIKGTWQIKDGVLILQTTSAPEPAFIILNFPDNDTMEMQLRMTAKQEQELKNTQAQLSQLDTSSVGRLDPQVKESLAKIKKQNLEEIAKAKSVYKRKK